MELEVTVTPNSREFRVRRAARGLAVNVTESAERGRANAELIKKLSRLLGCGVRIVRGFGSRRKILAVEIGADELEQRLGTAGQDKAP
ncbi:MAG: DUF167 domain-containing protein [Candidatus Micrarchaeia archaeon]